MPDLLPYLIALQQKISSFAHAAWEIDGWVNLFNSVLEVLALHQIRDIVLILILLVTTLVLLHVLVALGELAEGGEGVGAELVQDAGDELSEFLLLTVTVESEGVGGDGGVDWNYFILLVRRFFKFLASSLFMSLTTLTGEDMDGEKYPWEQRSG